jgi:predicted transcriptional regulator with HTH domain
MSNLAIHGAEIKGNAFDIIMYDGLNIIKQLDKKYYDFCEKNNNKNIETGLIILKFYGQEVISYANDILKAILDEGTIRLAATYISENPKQDAQRVLMKLGAIEKTREIHGYFIFKVTEYGKFLSERLNESSIANVSQKSTEIISPPPHTQSQSSPAS